MEDHPEVQAALLVASDQAGDGGGTTALANRMERLAVEEAGESMEYVLRLGSALGLGFGLGRGGWRE